MRTKMALAAGLFLLIVGGTAALGQQATLKTFTSPDGSFTFFYPANWFLETSEPGPWDMWTDQGGQVILSNLANDKRFDDPDGLMVQVAFPAPRTQYGMMGSGTTPVEIVRSSVRFNPPQANIPIVTPSSNGTRTPEVLDLRPPDLPITEFTVNGLPAARLINSAAAFGVEVSTMLIVVDVGNQHLVSISATSAKGGLKTIKAYEPIVVAIAYTLRYTPPKAVQSGNPDLPQVFSGPVGIWQRGTIKFFYPADWHVINFVTQIIQNTPDTIQANNLKPGQMQAMIQGPSETRVIVDPSELGNDCGPAKTNVTARSIMQKQLSLLAAQAAQLKAAEIIVSKPETVTINGKEMVYIRIYQGDFEILTIFIDLGKGDVPTLTAYTRRGEMQKFEKQLFAVAGTFEYTPKPCPTPTPRVDPKRNT